jgi:hypothetical protein
MRSIAGSLGSPPLGGGGGVSEIPVLIGRTSNREPLTGRGTMPEGQFDWGGFLPNSNGGVRRYTQHGRQSCVERKGRSVLNCERDTSSRCESRT